MATSVNATSLSAWLREFGVLIAANRDRLTELDSAIGDADHGSNMDRGIKAVIATLDDADPNAPGALLTKAGMTLVSTVGGASGPLFGSFFLRMGTALGKAESASDQEFAASLRAGLAGVVARGKASVGDKTMLDALTPAIDALDAALADGKDLPAALQASAQAAADGCAATIPLVAHKGRASYLGERSAGHQDPGATTVTLMLDAAASTF